MGARDRKFLPDVESPSVYRFACCVCSHALRALGRHEGLARIARYGLQNYGVTDVDVHARLNPQLELGVLAVAVLREDGCGVLFGLKTALLGDWDRLEGVETRARGECSASALRL